MERPKIEGLSAPYLIRLSLRHAKHEIMMSERLHITKPYTLF